MTARTPSGRLLFIDDEERTRYLTLWRTAIAERDWVVFNWCLMSNHVHFLVRTPDPDLGAGIKFVHERYAMWVNWRRGEHGHLFGDRFFNGVVVENRHFAGAMRYISRNPVEAGMVARAGAWTWSGHQELVGQVPPAVIDVDAALAMINEVPAAAQLAYEHWVLQPDLAVLATLEAIHEGDGWLIAAVVGHRIPREVVMSYKGWSVATYNRRLRAAREAEGTVPVRS